MCGFSSRLCFRSFGRPPRIIRGQRKGNAQISDGAALTLDWGASHRPRRISVSTGRPGSSTASAVVEDAICAAITRQWFDAEQVDVAVGVRQLISCARGRADCGAEESHRHLPARSGRTAFTGRNSRLMKPRGSTIAHALTHDACARRWSGGARTPGSSSPSITRLATRLRPTLQAAVAASGGKVLGSVRHPLNTADFQLLPAAGAGIRAPRSWRWPTAAAT